MSILSRVQANPEIGYDNSEFVEDLIERAKDFIVAYCLLDRFPILAQGYARSAEDAAEDLTGLSSNWLYVSVNGSGRQKVNLTLANCTDGDATAEELEYAIRNSGVVDFGFDEVTATFDTTSAQYTITSGRYGEGSCIEIDFEEANKAVSHALKLTPKYGGVSVPGSEDDVPLQTACVMLVEMKYRQLGLEGLKSGSIPGGVSFTQHDLDPVLTAILQARRRL